MHASLQPYLEHCEIGLIRKVISPCGRLVLFNYTDKCTYDKAWDEYTRRARGIIFEIETGFIVARPFEKFFNLGEMPETRLENLPDLPYTVQDKLDGSLGIIYHYDGKWDIATRGSFTSEQATYAREHLLLKYEPDIRLLKSRTYLVEIIYPENKIVVNYAEREELILLAVVNRTSGIEEEPTGQESFPSAATYAYTVPEMVALQKTLPKDREGFVVRYANGLRVKIKGEEYLKIHRVLLAMTPLSLWETMKNGKCDTAILEQIPEEYRAEWEPIVEALEEQYRTAEIHIHAEVAALGIMGITEKRDIGIYIKENRHKMTNPDGIFPCITGKGLDKYIINRIRPTGNQMIKKPRYER